MIPGGISPLLITSSTSQWLVVDTWDVNTQGDLMSFPNSQSGDMFLFVASSDNSQPNIQSGNGVSVIERNQVNTVGYGIFGVPNPGSLTSFRMTDVLQDFDQAIAFTVRADNNFTNTNGVTYKGDSLRATGSGNTPSHDNLSSNYSANSLALQLVFWNRDNVNKNRWFPPSGATLIESSTSGSNTGSLAVSFQPIGAAGSYSWGAWGQLNVSDDWVTILVEIIEP
jgi:hypothetical protein